VWYTKIAVAVDYTEDSVDYSLEHWITTDAQAQQVAAWFEDAWQRFFTDSGHHLYDTGCADTLNVRMEDGIGWSGIAYWGSSGNCWIGIDSPDVRAGGGQFTVYHEAQHYLQYSYDDGCYGFLKPNYPSDSEFVEGYADLGADSVTTTVDAMAYGGITYDPTTSMYDKSYGNIFNKYFIEQLGSYATPADPWHNIDALYTHYTMCDGADSLYVLNSVIPALNPTMSERKFFLNFFAANWAKDWADPVTQPELVYLDDDGNPYGSLVVLTQNINMAGGTQAFAGTTPDDWAANYYQVTPQAGCPYIQMDVNGEPGAQLGINLMTAKTTAPTKVVRSGYIGEDFTRTFAAAGQVNRVVAAINSFNSNFSYDVTFTCVNPIVNLLEPKQTNYVLVGEPATPIAFMARWEVLDGADNVRGLPQSAFTFDAEGAAATVVTGTFQEVGNEYWAVLLPPVKPAGTTFVDFKVTLTGADDDTELNALLYVDPGNSDIAISFDASGSMSTEDTIGEGTRLQLAKRAGQVIADLLRAGDRIVVQDWSANDVPGGCGLPGGDGNCPLDVRTLLPLSDATLAKHAHRPGPHADQQHHRPGMDARGRRHPGGHRRAAGRRSQHQPQVCLPALRRRRECEPALRHRAHRHHQLGRGGQHHRLWPRSAGQPAGADRHRHRRRLSAGGHRPQRRRPHGSGSGWRNGHERTGGDGRPGRSGRHPGRPLPARPSGSRQCL
jgi:hypothetical protein